MNRTTAPLSPHLALSILALSTLALTGCVQDGGGGEPASGDAAFGTVDEWPGGRHAVTYENGLGERITGVLELPPGAQRVPVVMVLHGSGGLFRPDGDVEDFDPALGEYERQFREWAGLLAVEGYAAFFPASFYSRGSFDWNERRIPGVDNEERLRLRVYDAVAGMDYLCRHPRIDCGKVAVVGFSNGGSTVLLSLYAGLAGHPDFPDVHVPPAERLPRIGVAYYPGCGLNGFIGLGDGDYRPSVPVLMFHGSDDDLIEHCETRIEQSDAYDGQLEHVVFPGVGHSFDGYPDGLAETFAEADARALTLLRIADAFRLGI